MATFTNETKNSSTLSNQSKSTVQTNWDEAEVSWDAIEGTWDSPIIFPNQTKNTSSISNQTKN